MIMSRGDHRISRRRQGFWEQNFPGIRNKSKEKVSKLKKKGTKLKKKGTKLKKVQAQGWGSFPLLSRPPLAAPD